MVNAGTFPGPIPLSNNRVGWLASEVAEWQRQQIAVRNAADQAERTVHEQPQEQEKTAGVRRRLNDQSGETDVSRKSGRRARGACVG